MYPSIRFSTERYSFKILSRDKMTLTIKIFVITSFVYRSTAVHATVQNTFQATFAEDNL